MKRPRIIYENTEDAEGFSVFSKRITEKVISYFEFSAV
jgi:hypothetical protein